MTARLILLAYTREYLLWNTEYFHTLSTKLHWKGAKLVKNTHFLLSKHVTYKF